ncbi:class I tRNA ligase family protein [Tenuifilum sp.]|uniref:class I tRNA ligase family protein n=1 Tax=Tenuifilum sp. TaxID=2760880 RepID=UPI0025888FB9|nr:class I tRNA ligase family protein [Tenuifilum sp.]
MPFITEELWQHLRNRADGESIMVSRMPESNGFDEKLLDNFERVKGIIAGIRNIRQEKNISPKHQLKALVKTSSKLDKGLEDVVVKLAGLEEFGYADGKVEGASSFMVGVDEVYIPLEGLIDVEEERKKILAELEYTRGFLNSVMKKLNNERFVNNAPADVVAMEQKKKSDAEAKIKALEERLNELK